MKPRLAVWKFSSCDGCQLTLLDCEDELLGVAEAVDIAYFLEATRTTQPGPYDVSLVEGSVSTAHEVERILQIRRDSRILITIGACATAGGIQALRNTLDHDGLKAAVYPSPHFIDALETSTPIADHVEVDFELRGCPIDKHQLLEAIAALVKGRKPSIPDYSQCAECKLAGTACVMMSKGAPCRGPVTQRGRCNLCTRVGRGCYGGLGTKEGANTEALAAELAALGADRRTIRDLFGGFTAGAPAFASERRRHDR
ncbi:MAG: oxidoreductase [bacterium]|nr:oxidoreductase [bacterium]